MFLWMSRLLHSVGRCLRAFLSLVMPTRFKTTWRPTRGYWPTAPLTGVAADYIYRGLNMVVRGGRGMTYAEQYKGLFISTNFQVDAGSIIPGTVATTSGSSTVTGTGTRFTRDLIEGQTVLIQTRLHTVTFIGSDTSIEIDPPAFNTASLIEMQPIRFVRDIDQYAATFVRGSAIRLPQGHLLGVGFGSFRLDRPPVFNTEGGIALTPQPQIKIVGPGSGTFRLGMATPILTTVAATTGGVKNMQQGTYSVRIVPARTGTGGFNQPSEAKDVTLNAVNQRINITFPSMDTATGQDAWRVYGTLTNGGLAGPWFFVQLITAAHLAISNPFPVEWHDAEISGNDLLEFDNDPAPPATYVSSIGGMPILIGTNGPGKILTGTVSTTNGSPTVTGSGTAFTTQLAVGRLIYINDILRRVVSITSSTSMTVDPTPTATASGLTLRSAEDVPGPVLRPAKPYLGGFNIEAFPARFAVALNPPENVLGIVEGIGRIYLLTSNRLHIAVLSGDPDLPVITRPFWRSGFRNPQACAFINGEVYGFTTNGATRSVGEGDGIAEEHAFAAAVSSDMARWNPYFVIVAYDPEQEAVCYIHADDGVTAGGERYSTMLMYMLRLGEWSTPIRIDHPTQHRWVTGAAAVNGRLILAVKSPNETILAFPSATNLGGSAFVATPFMDAEAEGLDKCVEGMVITAGSDADVSAGIYGSKANEDVPVGNLETATSPTSGAFTFPQSGTATQVRTSQRQKLNVKDLRVFAARIDVTSSSGQDPARVDEIALDGIITRHRY